MFPYYLAPPAFDRSAPCTRSAMVYAWEVRR